MKFCTLSAFGIVNRRDDIPPVADISVQTQGIGAKLEALGRTGGYLLEIAGCRSYATYCDGAQTQQLDTAIIPLGAGIGALAQGERYEVLLAIQPQLANDVVVYVEVCFRLWESRLYIISINEDEGMSVRLTR